MGAFSIWHWLIVLLILALVMGGVTRASFQRKLIYSGAGIEIYSPTQYICAALHTGYLNPREMLEYLQNRHKARLPELGLNVARILSEAKKARRRDAAFSIAALIVTLWIAVLLASLLPDLGSLADLQNHEPPSPLTLLGPFLIMAALGVFEALAVNQYLRNSILPLNDAPDLDSQQNVIIYGGFSPFASYGLDLDGWSMTLDTSKPHAEHAGKPQSFRQPELLDFLTKELEASVVLGDSFDKLFVNGQRIRGQKIFLYDNKAMPNTAVSAQVMASMIGKPSTETRHYRVFTVPYAHGHVHLTFFLRSTMVGDNVFIESRCFILPPLRAELTELNQLPTKRGFRYHARLILARLALAPFAWLRGPAYVASSGSRICKHLVHKIFGDPEDKAKARDETYNYGQHTSFRASWASPDFHTYFQWLDRDMLNKSCQHIILNSLVEFFESKGIDTSDIKERRTQIFNSGVIVSGGVVNTHQLAVGTGATAKAKISAALAPGKSKKG